MDDLYYRKSWLWERKCDGDVSCFLLLNAHLATTDVARGPVVKLVQAHLSKLSTDSSKYFQDIEETLLKLDWVRGATAFLQGCRIIWWIYQLTLGWKWHMLRRHWLSFGVRWRRNTVNWENMHWTSKTGRETDWMWRRAWFHLFPYWPQNYQRLWKTSKLKSLIKAQMTNEKK